MTRTDEAGEWGLYPGSCPSYFTGQLSNSSQSLARYNHLTVWVLAWMWTQEVGRAGQKSSRHVLALTCTTEWLWACI